MIAATGFAQRLGVTYRQLDYWIRAGVFEIDGDPAPGQGGRRVLTDREFEIGRVIVGLRRLGAGVDALREVAGQLRALDDWPPVAYVTANGVVSTEPSTLEWRVDVDRLLARERVAL